MDNAVLVEESLHGSNLIVDGTLGGEAHELFNGGDGKNIWMFEIIFLCGLFRLLAYFPV